MARQVRERPSREMPPSENKGSEAKKAERSRLRHKSTQRRLGISKDLGQSKKQKGHLSDGCSGVVVLGNHEQEASQVRLLSLSPSPLHPLCCMVLMHCVVPIVCGDGCKREMVEEEREKGGEKRNQLCVCEFVCLCLCVCVRT